MSGSRKKLKFEIWLHVGVASLIGLGWLAWSGGAHHGAATAGESAAETPMAKALEPVGTVVMKEDKPEAVARTGEEVVASGCGVCHNAGLAGAPKLDDSAKADWEARLVATGGVDGMITSAINGKGGMPARGGNPANTDDDMRNAVLSMLASSGVDVEAGASAETEEKAAASAEEAPKAEEGGASAGTEASTEEAPKTEEADATVDTSTEASETQESNATVAAATEAKTEEAPKAASAVASIADMVAPAEGEVVYKQICFACHDNGVANAPITGDKAVWKPRLEKGVVALRDFAVKGGGAMPAKGGNPNLSDAAVEAAVDYMIVQSR